MTFRKFTTLEKILIGFVLFLSISLLASCDKSSAEPETTPSAVAIETTPTSTPSPSLIVASYSVKNVIDGDTVEVTASDSSKLTIRLIGIDAPEKNTCLANEARDRLNEIVSAQNVELISDASQNDLDKYQRSLRYIVLPDGSDAGRILISEGLAREYTYDKKYERQSEYRSSEETAKEKRIGIWNPNTCATPTPQPTPASRPATPKPIVRPTVIPVAPSVTQNPSGYTCNCSKTCPNLSCEEAQYQLNTCGCSARDADDDGIACDSQCQ